MSVSQTRRFRKPALKEENLSQALMMRIFLGKERMVGWGGEVGAKYSK